MRLGTVLREMRERRKLVQVDVAKKLKISQTYLSQLETEKREPSPVMLRKLCKLYKVPVPAVVWLSAETEDVEKRKQNAFQQMKPVVDSLIAELLK